VWLHGCTLDCNVMSDASTHEPGSECRSCPVCLVLQALQEVRPEVRTHLIAAGRELVLALRAALAAETTPEGAGGRGSSDDELTAPSGGVSNHVTSDGERRRLRRIDIQ
jgi:hypothetical protein